MPWGSPQGAGVSNPLAEDPDTANLNRGSPPISWLVCLCERGFLQQSETIGFEYLAVSSLK